MEDILTGHSRRSTGVNNKINNVSGAPVCVKQASQCKSSPKKQDLLVKFY